MNYDAIAFWSQIAGSVLFIFALGWAFGKWLVPAVTTAQKASNERIAAAERHRDEMRAALDALRHAIEGAKRDGATMIERVKERAQQEHDAIVAEAQAAGERALRNAEGELARARAEARAKLREELAAKALDIARAGADARIDAATNARLVEEFLERVSRG